MDTNTVDFINNIKRTGAVRVFQKCNKNAINVQSRWVRYAKTVHFGDGLGKYAKSLYMNGRPTGKCFFFAENKMTGDDRLIPYMRKLGLSFSPNGLQNLTNEPKSLPRLPNRPQFFFACGAFFACQLGRGLSKGCFWFDLICLHHTWTPHDHPHTAQ